ncbi:hypothetical protein [Maridesulfovibrio ferrireducens]|uniref:hypothetical protein n=1 Tax=Maridesulfovibrio ferrireducens TaxID=246191 RepID=UPI001A3194E1|nr:hypothetical protein [Maridesulfovibrio ferrireducens]MBI9111931.1 hypothetical protein [Maridesulfovibrio ferrireducens]
MTDSINYITANIQPFSVYSPDKDNNQITLETALKKNQGIDKVTISSEAIEKYNTSSKTESTPADSWKMLSGLDSGTTLLKNGNKQVVTIDGTKLEILEYDGDKLIRSVKGDITAEGAVLETEIYDDNGKLTQTINTSLKTMDGGKKGTSAKISRDIKWFENGEMTRQMSDHMRLHSEYIDPAEKGSTEKPLSRMITDLTKAQSSDLNKITERATKDTHTTKYFASIQEFANGNISRSVVINNNADFVNITNRSSKRVNGREKWTTGELSHSNGLSVTMQNYDSNGDLLRESSFNASNVNDKDTTDGKIEQKMSVSWYNKGDLVKKSSGSLSMEETPHKGLPSSATLLKTLGLEEKEYATPKTKTAIELLAVPLMESSSKAEFYNNSIADQINSGSFNSSENISKYGEDDRPYSISWENEIYKNGELAARQEDKESAIENFGQKDIAFRTGGALSEDYSGPIMHRTSHVDESYENGSLKKQASIESYEYIQEVKKGSDKLLTRTNATQGTGYDKQHVSELYEGGVTEHDVQANAASKAMSGEVGLTLEDSRSILRSLSDKNSGPKNHEYKVKFDPA